MALLFCTGVYSQHSVEVTGELNASGVIFDQESPFWFYTNTNGLRAKNTNFAVSAFAKANYSIKENHQLEVGLGGYLRDGFTQEFQRSQLYGFYSNTIFSVTVGSKDPSDFNQGLSTINDNILNTGNTRAIPGVLLETSKPIHFVKWLSAEAQLGHYRLNDQRRTDKTNVHYKSLVLKWRFNHKTTISTGLKHYVQWGGVTQGGLMLPNDFKAFTEVFFGKAASGFDNPNEAINALGNHLGSYNLALNHVLSNSSKLSLYHHTLFEDRSGRELNNFPDGVWGVTYSNSKNKWFNTVLYEYVQTVSQSGRPTATTTSLGQQSGGDNYFSNSIYPSGWTYDGVTIGLPFINPVATSSEPLNNRVFAHHLGLISKFENLVITSKITYLKNLGTYGVPIIPNQEFVLSQILAKYRLSKSGVVSLQLGADFKKNASNNVGVGVGYTYSL